VLFYPPAGYLDRRRSDDSPAPTRPPRVRGPAGAGGPPARQNQPL